MSRPASCSAVYGTTPGVAWVVDFWKNSGTISTRPPTATTSRISTIIRKLLVSTFSWLKPVGLVLVLMVVVSLGSHAAWGTGTLTRTDRPPTTVIHVFQLMTSMPAR